MGRDAQRARRLTRKKGTVGADGPPGTASGYHDLKAAREGRCLCGSCANAARLAEGPA